MALAPGVWRRGRTDGYEKTEGLAMDGKKDTRDLKNIEREGRREREDQK